MKQIVTIWFFLFSIVSFGQEQQEDLKVGLVLSGGGAKGLAHIGALRVIEESGVRIDYIGGTSMGAVIGSLYAAGYSTRQLDSIFGAVDFETLIRDEVPRQAKTFYEKEDAEKYALTLPFDKFHVSFPSGISKGQNIYNLLSRLLIHVKDEDDFNELPIPFFCIATNVETGQEVVLDKGYLPRAVTASAALPSLLSPVTIGDIMYVDGGIVNNYPVDRVKALGADIVIGIDVQDTLRGRKELKSALDLMVQINNYRTIEDMIEKKKKTDIYINPLIDDFTVVSFDEGRKIIEAGIDAASMKKTDLEDLASRQLPKERRNVEFDSQKPLYVRHVNIEGNENYTKAYILGKLKLKVPAEITYEEFNQGVNNLSATGNFDGIDYNLVEDPDNTGEYIIRFLVKESDSKTVLRLGVHHDGLFRTAGLINITTKRLLTSNDVASVDFIVGDNLRYNLDYYIDKGYYWSYGGSSSFNTFKSDVSVNFILRDLELTEPPAGLNKISLAYEDFTNTLFMQTVFKRSFLLRFGGEHKWLRYLSETIGQDENNLPRTIFENNNYFSAYGILKYDTFDNKYFPKSGLYFEGDFHWYLFSQGINEDFSPFSVAKAELSYAAAFTDKLSLIFTSEGGVKIGGRETTSFDFFAGGYGFKPLNNIIPFYGYEALSIRGDTYLKSELTFDYEIFRHHHVNVSGNIANIGNGLLERGEWIDGIDYSGFAVGYGLETLLGPIELKYSFSPERSTDEWYVNVGFRF